MSCGMPATIRASSAELAQEGEAAGRRRLSIGPGTRKQARPCSSAHDAVMSAPLRAGCLDDDGRVGQPADDPVPARERAPRRLDVRRELGDDGAATGATIAPPSAGVGRRPDARGRHR